MYYIHTDVRIQIEEQSLIRGGTVPALFRKKWDRLLPKAIPALTPKSHVVRIHAMT